MLPRIYVKNYLFFQMWQISVLFGAILNHFLISVQTQLAWGLLLIQSFICRDLIALVKSFELIEIMLYFPSNSI